MTGVYGLTTSFPSIFALRYIWFPARRTIQATNPWEISRLECVILKVQVVITSDGHSNTRIYRIQKRIDTWNQDRQAFFCWSNDNTDTKHILQTSFHQISNIPKVTVTYCNSRPILVKLDNTHTYQQVTQAYAQVTAIQIETYECHDW